MSEDFLRSNNKPSITASSTRIHVYPRAVTVAHVCSASTRVRSKRKKSMTHITEGTIVVSSINSQEEDDLQFIAHRKCGHREVYPLWKGDDVDRE